MQTKLLIILAVPVASALSAVIAGGVAYSIARQGASSLTDTKTASLHRLNFVDASGRICMMLSAEKSLPEVDLFGPDGKKRMTMTVDAAGYGAIHLINPNPSGPVASLEIDNKGTHVKFDRPGGASSYLFLNNSGGSGAVFLDPAGVRKLVLTVSPSGHPEIQRYDQPPSESQ